MSQRLNDNAGGTEIADGSTGDVAIADNDIILVLDADGNFADTEAASLACLMMELMAGRRFKLLVQMRATL